MRASAGMGEAALSLHGFGSGAPAGFWALTSCGQERSRPRGVCLGRECSPALTRGDVGGQSLAACPAPSGARDGAFPSLPTLVFTAEKWMERFVSLGGEEGIVDVFSWPVEFLGIEVNRVKNIINAETSSEAVLSPQRAGFSGVMHWGHISPPMCFASQRTGLLETGRFPGRLPKAEVYFAATLHLSSFPRGCVSKGGPRGAGGLQWGQRRGCPSGRKPSQSRHPSPLCLHRSSPHRRGRERRRVPGRTGQAEWILLAPFPKSLCPAATVGSLFSIEG